MTAKNFVFEMTDTAITQAFQVEGVNTVRVGVVDGKKTTFVASATLYPRGYSVRKGRRVFSREQTAEQAQVALANVASATKGTVAIHALVRDAKLKPVIDQTVTKVASKKTKKAA